MMKRFKVILVEKLIYETEVEAESKDDAYERWVNMDQDEMTMTDCETVSVDIEETPR